MVERSTEVELTLLRGKDYKIFVNLWRLENPYFFLNIVVDMFKNYVELAMKGQFIDSIIAPYRVLKKYYECIENSAFKEEGKILTLGQCIWRGDSSLIVVSLPNSLKSNSSFHIDPHTGETAFCQECFVTNVSKTIEHEYVHSAIWDVYGNHPEWVVRKLTGEPPEPKEEKI